MAKRRKKPTVWQAFNDPVVEIHESFARLIFIIAVILLLVAWIAPYWHEARLITSVRAPFYGPLVAGAITAPDWYYVAADVPGQVAGAWTAAASEVLDISDDLRSAASFYQPGASAVTDAWLELMADPTY